MLSNLESQLCEVCDDTSFIVRTIDVVQQEFLVQVSEWQFGVFCISFANEESSSATVKHCSDSFSIDLGLDLKVISAWHYFTNVAREYRLVHIC